MKKWQMCMRAAGVRSRNANGLTCKKNMCQKGTRRGDGKVHLQHDEIQSCKMISNYKKKIPLLTQMGGIDVHMIKVITCVNG
jgi:hypothetical protein